jgi:hypothetical protein
MGYDGFQRGAGKGLRQIAADSSAEEQCQSLCSNKQVLTASTYADLRSPQRPFELSDAELDVERGRRKIEPNSNGCRVLRGEER